MHFKEARGLPLDGVWESATAFADVDNDGDLDLFISGMDNSGVRTSKLYINDGFGNFKEHSENPFIDVSVTSLAFADINNNGAQDLVITGINNSNIRVTRLYVNDNDGSGNFTESSEVFEGVTTSPNGLALVDIDGDTYPDLMITGFDGTDTITKIYLNNQGESFIEDTSHSIPGTVRGSVVLADLNGDTNNDLVIVGRDVVGSSFNFIAKIYLNNGSGVFTEKTSGVPFEGVFRSYVSVADIDNDGDQDVLITGENSSGQPISKLYTNDGSGNFTEQSAPFEEVRFSSASFADIDGNGDIDVIISGVNSSNQGITKLYTNQVTGGNAVFTEFTDFTFDTAIRGENAIADVNNNGQLDILITGENNDNERIAKLYRNLPSAINEWTGSEDSNWNNPNNWSSASVPSATDVIDIPSAPANQPVIDASTNAEVGMLEVLENAHLEVIGSLSVVNEMINDGEMVFKSTDSQTGQLDTSRGNYTGEGFVEAERFLPAGQRAFRFYASSINSNGSIRDNLQEGVNNTGFDYPDDNENPNSGFGIHITGSTDGSNGFDATETGNPSMFVFDNSLENQSGGAAWSPISNTNVNSLEAGTPYRILVRGDREINMSSNNPSATATTLRVRGGLQVGSFSPSLSTFDGNFSFVGNPYQAAVDFTALTFEGDVNSQFIYVWDPQVNANGAFVTIEDDGTNNNPSSDADQYIQPGQAFFIRNNTTVSTAPSLSFTEDSKRIAEESLTTFSSPNFSRVNLQVFSLNDNGETHPLDGVNLRLSEDFSSEVNDKDAGKMANSGENLAIVQDNKLLSIESRKLPTENESVQLFMNSFQNSDYSFHIQTQNLPEETLVYVKDNYLNQQVLIDEDNPYVFDVDPNIADSASILRFELLFENETLSNSDFEAAGFSLYPNPVSNMMYITGIKDEARVHVFDLVGREVLKTKLKNAQGIDMSNLNQGVYLVQVNQNGNSFTKKIIKNKTL